MRRGRSSTRDAPTGGGVDSRIRGKTEGVGSGEIIRWCSELQVDGMVEWVPASGDLCITVIPAKAGIQNPMI